MKPMAPGGKLVELARDEERLTIRSDSFTFTPDSTHILYATQALSDGVWRESEFRVIPVEGGTPRTIPVSGSEPSFLPDGRLIYSTGGRRADIWMVRNLPLK